MAHLVAAAAAQPPDDAPNLELASSLRASVDTFESLPGFDFAGLTTVKEEFGTGAQLRSTYRFRMQMDRKRKVLTYVCENWDKDPVDALFKPDKRYTSVLINDTTVNRNNVNDPRGSARTVKEMESFESAIVAADVPLPGYWALTHFPARGSGPVILRQLMARVTRDNATVTVTPGDRTVGYVARINDKIRFDNWHWEFRLPTYSPVSVKLQRTKGEQAETVFEQSVIYTPVDGYDVPLVIDSWRPLLRTDRVVRKGKKHRFTQFKWLRIGDDAFDARRQPLTKVDDVIRFLNEGIGPLESKEP